MKHLKKFPLMKILFLKVFVMCCSLLFYVMLIQLTEVMSK